MDRYDYLFKFLIIGNSGSGKTCLMSQFVEQKFRTDSTHTIGVEFGSKVVELNKKRIKLQVWDTAGQERFRSVTRSYYRGAAGALLVYDIAQRGTFNMLANWLEDARNLASQHLCVVLIGNKKDLEERREVPFLEASQFAQDNQLIFLETSALTGENVEESFIKCAQTILQKVEDGEIEMDSVSSGISCSAAMKETRRNSLLGKQVNVVDILGDTEGGGGQNVVSKLGDYFKAKSNSCNDCSHR